MPARLRWRLGLAVAAEDGVRGTGRMWVVAYTESCKLRVMGEKREPYDGTAAGWTPERVAEVRARLGLSQAAFARRMGVRQQTVSEWETGRHTPRGASATLLGFLAEEAATYDAAPPDRP